MTFLKIIPIRDIKIVMFVTAIDTVKMFRKEGNKTVAQFYTSKITMGLKLVANIDRNIYVARFLWL